MIKPLEIFIGLRYTRSKQRNRFISFISVISIFGIMIGVWALITIMSIMNGFHKDLRDKILFVVSHITVSGYNGLLSDWQNVSKLVSWNPRIQYQAPFIVRQGMIMQGRNVAGTLIRGIDPQKEEKVSQIMKHVVEGKTNALRPGNFGIILGKSLARNLDVTVGDKVIVVTPKIQITPAGLFPRLKRFSVVGLFEIHMHEYDTGVALIHIKDAAKIFSMKEHQVSGIRVKLDDPEESRQVRHELFQKLGRKYHVSDWTLEYSHLFRALEIEKRVVFLVLLLIVSVAAFNIVSTSIMLVTDKQSDVAILMTLGFKKTSVMKVFIVQGIAVGIIGTLIGGVLGVMTSLNLDSLIQFIERLLNTSLFPDDVYIISHFPGEMRWSDISIIIFISIAMSFLATIYPAWRASKVEPTEVLRHK